MLILDALAAALLAILLATGLVSLLRARPRLALVLLAVLAFVI